MRERLSLFQNTLITVELNVQTVKILAHTTDILLNEQYSLAINGL